MLNEIILPDDYTGTITQENAIIGDINENFTELEKQISELNSTSVEFEDHIVDFEDYEIDLYFGNNKKKATISVQNEIIEVKVNGITIKIDSDGNVI